MLSAVSPIYCLEHHPVTCDNQNYGSAPSSPSSTPLFCGSFVATCMKLKGIMLSKIIAMERLILYDISSMWNLKKKKKEKCWSHRNRLEWQLPGPGVERGKWGDVGQRVHSVIIWISSENLTCSTSTTLIIPYCILEIC